MLHVRGPRAEALLLRAWLRSRLKRDVELRHEDARELPRGRGRRRSPVRTRRRLMRSASDLLSAELEVFGRDPIYEAAVRSV